MRRALLLLCLLTACRSPDGPLVLAHVTVVDVVSGTRQPDVSVVIENDKIVAIRKGSVRGKVVDARGKFLIPGLWDMHAHIWDPDREVPLMVANGVLSARDMGNEPDLIFRLRDDINAGKRLGPRIVACGPIVDGPQPTNPRISVAVKNAEEGREAVRRLKRIGADCIKVHDGVPRDAYVAIADEARQIGLPLVGHIPVALPTLDAPHLGQRSIEHQIGLRGASGAEPEILQFEAEHDVMAEAMKTGEFTLIPENIARKGKKILDAFDPARADALYREFAKDGTYLDPTLVTQYALTFVDDLAARDDPRMKYVPAKTREWWHPSKGMLTRYRTPAYIAYRKREFAKTLEQIPVAHRAGVQFLTGTDMSIPYVYPGFSVHDELALFVRAGLTPAEALQTATINPARMLGIDGETGTIAPGKRADLVLLDADPLVDIANTKTIRAVIVRGQLLDRGALDELLSTSSAARTP